MLFNSIEKTDAFAREWQLALKRTRSIYTTNLPEELATSFLLLLINVITNLHFPYELIFLNYIFPPLFVGTLSPPHTHVHRYGARAGLSVLVLGSTKGQLSEATSLENYPAGPAAWDLLNSKNAEVRSREVFFTFVNDD